MNRGLAVVVSHKLIAQTKGSKGGPLTPESLRKAQILGWCVELLQSFFLVADDVMDHSEMRRGKPCWYKREDVGLDALNDAILLEAGIYKLLHKHFREESYYVDLLELFHDVIFFYKFFIY